jgi:hypothetical protein
MLDVFWWILFVYIAVRILWWLWRPAPPTLLRPDRRSHRDSHDAAVSIAAVLGVRDGSRTGNRRPIDDGDDFE